MNPSVRLVPTPRLAPRDDWAQINADRGLENIAGCRLRNADRIHPEVREGDELRLHPKMRARAAGKRWAAATWMFSVEPLGPHRSRLISRYRCATSDDLASRLALGPTLIEPIGFAMDRRMLSASRRAPSASCRADRVRSMEGAHHDRAQVTHPRSR
jgi:hypothetical protein